MKNVLKSNKELMMHMNVSRMKNYNTVLMMVLVVAYVQYGASTDRRVQRQV